VTPDLESSWDDRARRFPSAAPFAGPFPFAPFLEAWARHAAAPGAEQVVVSSADGALPIWIDDRAVRFQGQADLTDYHSPLGDSIDACMVQVAERYAGYGFSFDSLPEEALGPVVRSLEGVSASVAASEHSATVVLDLPTTFETWLAGLSKKHRHEIRRKQRRFGELVGEAVYERRSDPEAFAAFVDMHRKADGAKGTFMTARVERFFRALLTEAGATVDVLSVAGRPVAAAFGFADNQGYYLYNSAYEPELVGAAPGIVLLAAMIERSISDGVARFDFLKGDERYKYHLGGVERPLWIVAGAFA
jgi:CelD/BcsL family acetyltransferase involved in cellulose biosynthesis